MAERRAMQKYYPPDWTPDKGSINTFVGQHPLRDRARKLNQGILIIRFELPFNIWCDGCGNHIGMGVRYNAEKKKAGMYLTTPIWSFRMKCHLCDNWFEIQTDPKNTAYNVVAGARGKNETWEAKDSETIDLKDDDEHKKRLVDDAMYRLEHGENDKKKAQEQKPRLTQLQDIQEKWKDDYDLNCVLRRKFRQERKEIQRIEEESRRIQEKAAIAIRILPEAKEDIERAAGMRYAGQLRPGFREHRHKKRLEILSQSIFDRHDAPASNGFTMTRKTKSTKGVKASASIENSADAFDGRTHRLALIERKRQIGLDHRNFRVLGVEGHLGQTDVDVAGLVQPKRRRMDDDANVCDEDHARGGVRDGYCSGDVPVATRTGSGDGGSVETDIAKRNVVAGDSSVADAGLSTRKAGTETADVRGAEGATGMRGSLASLITEYGSESDS
eukprot:Opistho-2@22966